MGSPMAQNLINAGCDVTVWNRTESKRNPPYVIGCKATKVLANLDTGLTGCDDNDESDMKTKEAKLGRVGSDGFMAELESRCLMCMNICSGEDRQISFSL
ncbi:hypothetical protein RHGRI_018699 [Rhododendron griersonianum]|uniref:6-phosphogluconate dehydrogenase NADP-binding domain-containing protein n=1 Tax=Rhododendron griersonianum TaxID=479676 RepID=A0AAV6K2K5_9ERIC|nr:hypothetical protein RHGRI_018699 [Rhododendron griersonianum]